MEKNDKRLSDLAKIYMAKRELGLSDEEYTDILYFYFGVLSTKDLTDEALIELLRIFRGKGWRPKFMVKKNQSSKRQCTGKENVKKIADGPLARQKQYILALWNALGFDMAMLDARCKKQFKIERFEWLQDENHLHILIADLRARCMLAGIDPSPGGR